MLLRGKRSSGSAAVLVVSGMVLAQLAGCGSCVKDDPPSGRASGKKPIDLRAADKRFSQYSEPDAQAADAAARD